MKIHIKTNEGTSHIMYVHFISGGHIPIKCSVHEWDRKFFLSSASGLSSLPGLGSVVPRASSSHGCESRAEKIKFIYLYKWYKPLYLTGINMSSIVYNLLRKFNAYAVKQCKKTGVRSNRTQQAQKNNSRLYHTNKNYYHIDIVSCPIKLIEVSATSEFVYAEGLALPS